MLKPQALGAPLRAPPFWGPQVRAWNAAGVEPRGRAGYWSFLVQSGPREGDREGVRGKAGGESGREAQRPRPTMDLYLSACSKAASVAATKTATSSLEADSQECGDVSGMRSGVTVRGQLPGRVGQGEPLTVPRLVTVGFWRSRASWRMAVATTGWWLGNRSQGCLAGRAPTLPVWPLDSFG